MIGDYDVDQFGAAMERMIADAGDRQAIDRARDVHCTAGTGIFGDRDRTVMGGVIFLGSNGL